MNMPRRDFTNSAVIAMVLYLFFWVPGFIANVAYLGSAAKERKRTGVRADGVGCLWSLLFVFLVIPLLFFLLFLFNLGRQ